MKMRLGTVPQSHPENMRSAGEEKETENRPLSPFQAQRLLG